jgi:hypothetical protein
MACGAASRGRARKGMKAAFVARGWLDGQVRSFVTPWQGGWKGGDRGECGARVSGARVLSRLSGCTDLLR